VSWRAVLLVGAVLAVVAAGVGLFLDKSALQVRGTADLEWTNTWPAPFEREIWYRRGGSDVVLAEGDENLWYFAAGAILVLTLASIPLLRERDRRRAATPSD
jgi:hypothetical protein